MVVLQSLPAQAENCKLLDEFVESMRAFGCSHIRVPRPPFCKGCFLVCGSTLFDYKFTTSKKFEKQEKTGNKGVQENTKKTAGQNLKTVLNSLKIRRFKVLEGYCAVSPAWSARFFVPCPGVRRVCLTPGHFVLPLWGVSLRPQFKEIA